MGKSLSFIVESSFLPFIFIFYLWIFSLIERSNGIIFLLVDWRIRNMTIAFQLAVFALIATSLILLISVPVVFASPDGWSSNKNVVFSGTSLWIGLVFLVAILNSLIS
uniref:Photosystem II reaction center protein Z n=95 Tax=Melastomataceae TaxID=39998 RepID=A0A7D4V8S8_9MYRT|nr:photosystem II protein Z [Medinilla magnifica]QKS31785.1 photosystem II protein Z [Medinilla magnifica]